MKKIILTMILALCVSASFASGTGDNGPSASNSTLAKINGDSSEDFAVKDLTGTSATLSEKVKAAWAEITGNLNASGTTRLAGPLLVGTTSDDGVHRVRVVGDSEFDGDVEITSKSILGEIEGTYLDNITESNTVTKRRVGGVVMAITGDAVTSSITTTAEYTPLYNWAWPASYTGRLTLTCVGNQETATIMCREGATPEFRIIDDTGSLFAITDTASKYCVYSSGGVLRIKNNTGTYGLLIAKWEGLP